MGAPYSVEGTPLWYDMILEVKTFYEKLYGINEDLMDVNLTEILQPFNVPKLDRTTADPWEEYITETEILAVLKNMKNNKSPLNFISSFGLSGESSERCIYKQKTAYIPETWYYHLLTKRR